MRTTPDRIRHAVLFEVLGVLIVSPLAGWAFDLPVHRVGVLAFGMSLLAMAWNYAYNLLFDHALLNLRGRVHKTVPERLVHAVAFEAGMFLISIPPTVWWMQVSIGEALLLSASLTVFYLVYTYLFNLGYDWAFPLPEEHTSWQDERG
ncbi:MAG: PACE efflux transporter [Ectothiorhodospiraceae bacterium]|jgi:uncharacterized membrane protein